MIHPVYLVAAVLMSVTITTSADIKDCIIDAALVVDNSGSITNNKENMQNWDFVIKFAQDLAKGINIGPQTSHIGLVDFHSWATVHFTLNEHTTEDSAVKAIGELEHVAQATNTPEALQYGRELLTDPAQGARPGVPKVLFMITDGEPTPKYSEGLDEEIALTKAAGIRIVAIGVTAGVKPETLKKMASTESDFFIADTFESLKKITDSVLTEDTCKPPPRPIVPIVPIDETMLLGSCDA